LLEALRALVPGASNRTLRRMISHDCVRLNGKVSKIARQQTGAGDVLEISRTTSVTARPGGVRILYDDSDLLVVHKPAGLLTVATAHEHERTAYAHLREHLRTRNPRTKLFIVHRLDKFASGILVFAKSESVKMKLQDLFRQHDIERKYYAIVEGRVKNDRGTITSRLAQDRGGRMRSTHDSQGKHAVTHYRVLGRFSTLTSLEVTLETGRKNQIRVHLSEMGHPIVGDLAYGSTLNPLDRLGLHAFLLGFRHPTRGTPLLHSTGPPPEFRRYIPKSS
jgi:23S rRNA pseudouridine1911/1915/1917 synthase